MSHGTVLRKAEPTLLKHSHTDFVDPRRSSRPSTNPSPGWSRSPIQDAAERLRFLATRSWHNPFSAKRRGHRVLINHERWVEAMCAIDALGIAPMLGLPIKIYSRDPLSGGQIRVELDPVQSAWWEPQEAVVVSGSAGCENPSFRGCCEVLNFFEWRENAERYLTENASVSGHPISLPEAIEAGRIVFGDILLAE